MNLDDSLNAATRVLRRRPTEVLPPFLADSALAVVAQLALVAGALGLLAVRGTDRFRRLFAAIGELEPPVTGAESAALEAALRDLFTPTAIGIVLATVVLATALAVVVRAAAGAAKVHAARAAMSDGDPCTAAVAGTFADTGTFVWLTLLQLLLFAGPLLAGAAGLVAVGGEAGLAILGFGFLLWIPLSLATYFLLLFVPEIVVVEGVGLFAGIRRNLSYLADHPGRAVVFGLLELGTLVVVGGIGGGLGAFGVGRVTALITLFLAFPLLGLVKMGLYVTPGEGGVPAGDPVPPAGGVEEGWTTESAAADRDPRGASDPARERREDRGPDRGRRGGTDDGWRDDHGRDPSAERSRGSGEAPDDEWRDEWDRPVDGPGRDATGRRPGPEAPTGPGIGGASLLADLRSILGESVAELRAFVPERVGLVGVSLATFFAGLVVGYWIGTSTGIEVATTPPTRDVFGPFPLDVAVNLSANNWQVAIGQAYAGAALGLPVLGNLAFNGAIVGGLAGLGFDPATFAALVVPHGVIEIPALAVGGAVGLFVAGRGWALYRGRITPADGGRALRRAFLVLVGLGPVFLVAGFVEAFLTPTIAALLVG